MMGWDRRDTAWFAFCLLLAALAGIGLGVAWGIAVSMEALP